MGVAVSSSQLVSAARCPSGGGLLTLCPCYSMESLPQETVLHKVLQCVSFPQAVALHKLPQCRSFPRSAVRLGAGCSSVGLPQGHKPCQQTCSSTGFSFHGSAGPGRSLLQCGLPTGSQPPSGVHLLRQGVPSTGCRWRSAPPWTSMGCRGTACLNHGLHHGLHRKTLFSSISSTDPGVCRVVSLTSSHSSLPSAVSHCFFLPLLKHVITEVLHRHWLAWPWPAACPSYSCLALALSDMGEAYSSFSQEPPL